MHKSIINSNSISAIKSPQGEWIENQRDIANQFEKHFIEVYNRKHKMIVDKAFLPKRTLTPAASAWLSRPFSEEVILKGLKSINRYKASGPDGFTLDFFQDN